MDKQDFSFMKTGFDATASNSAADDELLENVTTLIVTYMDGAIRTAAMYLSHGPRKVITPEDIKRAMMLEVFFIDKRPDLLEKAEKIRKELFEDESEDEAEDENRIVEEVEEDAFALNSCDCVLCTYVKNAYEQWAAWEPSSPLEELLKKNIDKM